MKHAICLILSLFLCCFFAVGDNTPSSKNTGTKNALCLSTIVIDAGHGGKDPGAVSKDKKTYEKTFTLDIANRFAECVRSGLPQVKVILTRSKDEFIELRQRADIANKADANLFISIHINSNNSTSPNGYSVHILGQSSQKDRDLFAYNMDMVKRENSVIMLEDNYQTHYQGFNPSDSESYIFMQLMQNAFLEQSLLFASIVSEKLRGGPIKNDRGIDQNPFYVLWRTSMPAVLIELGYISNQNDLVALQNAEDRQIIAQRLFEALNTYKTLYDSSVKLGGSDDNQSSSSAPATKPTSTATTSPTPATAPTAAASAQSAKPSSAKPATVPVEAASAQSAKPTTANDAASAKTETTTTAVATPNATPVLYGTQVFATSTRLDPSDKRLLGWEPTVIQTKSLYKYIIGVCDSKAEATKNFQKLKSSFPGCFMVKIVDGKTERAD